MAMPSALNLSWRANCLGSLVAAVDMKHEFVPASSASRLDHVGSYRRRLPVSLDRMYENVLDWQHLPYLHDSSFSSIECDSAGAWGWRATITSQQGSRRATSTLELLLDRDARRWITRNLAGPSAGAEIWTHVFVAGDRALDIVVDFFVPGVSENARDKVGMAYANSYERLYDEDVEMMTERQRQLDQRLDGVNEAEVVELGRVEALALPAQVMLSGRYFVVNKLGDIHADGNTDWVVYPAQCPHQLGPLYAASLDEGQVTCPWHGYVFDVVSGDCLSGSHCRLGRVPAVVEGQDGVQLRWV